jgi:hypothetical protein
VVFLPLWIVLLGVLPFATGLGPLACLSLATLAAAAAVVVVERRRARRAARPATRPADGPPAPRRPMGALTAAGLTLGAVVLLIYVIFVLRSA